MDAKGLVEKQREYFNTNATKDPAFRVGQLKKLKALLKANEARLNAAIYEDFGKSEFETYLTELSQIYHEIDMFVKKVPRWSRRKRVPGSLANVPSRSYILPEPLGTTLVIGAWNYPYNLSLIPALSALAAGNTVILKPSELPARTSQIMAEIINQGFSDAYFHVVEGGVEETTELLENAFDKVFFTGSIPVGRIIYQKAARHLTPVTLELGGKSPTFVLSGCDIRVAARRIAWAKFLNAGQTCIAPDYVLVEKEVEAPLLAALKEEIQTRYAPGETLRENYVQIINERNLERLAALIDPAKVHHGGEVDRDTRTISPTLMNGVNFEDPVMEDELFGPVLPVIAFSDLDEAIGKVKERSKPLACYVYAKDRVRIRKILREVSFGGGAVNDSLMHLSNPNLPFGGVGASGMGNYHGKAGFRAFTHYKSILDKPTFFEAPLKYWPYAPWKLKLIRRMFN
ncbi:aldehyde dehydrogenase [Desulfoluna butyratoxydans]|uniref:Aldehyde dehydrogenase n=1 Tax=Desulfoluna butyratoxydans TaxID=231438 RepID=A0A4U8YR52_9BACT|nr:aldehyde dehydrogenase [Desulfoluna butyratoxydans]VFQ44262.1 aldehyde/histidinol dehydrogenase [Desulfoluna butyratoxydans]